MEYARPLAFDWSRDHPRGSVQYKEYQEYKRRNNELSDLLLQGRARIYDVPVFNWGWHDGKLPDE